MLSRRGILIRLVIALVVTTAAAGHALTIRQASIEEVTADAATIVHGTVSDVRAGRDERGAPAVWITIDVVRTLKGAPEPRLVFKQLGAPPVTTHAPAERGAARGARSLIGLPGYRVGEEIVLFLAPESALGFTAPVGIGQGVYRVRREAGRARARRDLAPGPPAQDLDELLGRVSRLLKGPR